VFRFAVSKMWVRQCMLYARRVVCARTILLGARGVSHVFLRDLEHGKATIQFGLVLQVLDELGIRMELDVPDDARERLNQLMPQLRNGSDQ